MRLTILVSLLLLSAAAAHAEPSHDTGSSARFSGKRLAVEILTGEVVGGLASGLTFRAVCDGTDCFGSGIAAFGMNIAITPLAVWGVGTAMGGNGSLGYSYLGASLALTPFSVTGSSEESPSDALSRIEVEVVVSSLLLAPCSALMYEATSQMSWVRDHAVGVAVQPVHDRDGLTGAVGVVSARW